MNLTKCAGVIGIVLVMLVLASCHANLKEDSQSATTSGTEDALVDSTGAVEPKKSVIKIAISEWEPYTGAKILDQGMLTAITVAAFEKVGYQTEITLLPWVRCIDQVKSGEFDAIIGASYTQERLSYFYYSDVLWPSQVAFFCQCGQAGQYDSLEKLAPAIIGVYNGSNLIEVLEKTPGITLEPVESVEQNIHKLISGRVDYIIDSKDAVQYILKTSMKEDSANIKVLEPSYSQDDLFVAFSKKTVDYAQLALDFNKGLKAIKDEGVYNQIVKRFGLD